MDKELELLERFISKEDKTCYNLSDYANNCESEVNEEADETEECNNYSNENDCKKNGCKWCGVGFVHACVKKDAGCIRTGIAK